MRRNRKVQMKEWKRTAEGGVKRTSSGRSGNKQLKEEETGISKAGVKRNS